MRILMLNYEFPPLGGGAGNATYYLLREFSRRKDLEIDLVTSSTGDTEKKEKFSDNINVYYLNIGKKTDLSYQSAHDLLSYSVRSLFFTRSIKKKYSYDLIHAFFGIPCGFLAMRLNVPYIVSLRGSDVPFYNKRFKMLDKIIFSRLSRKIWHKAEYVVANSRGLKDLAENNGTDKDIMVINNGIDVNEFVPLFSENKNNRIRLISTGRLIRRKGYEYLIKALKDEKDFELQLIGDGNIRNELMELAAQMNAPVKFLGHKDHSEIKSYLKKSDIFILPSLNEGMSNSVLEAMASGLPIIMTDVGGSGELINGNGVIVRKRSIEDIKDVLNRYRENRDLLIRQGKVSRDIAESMSWNNVAGEYGKLYRMVCKR